MGGEDGRPPMSGQKCKAESAGCLRRPSKRQGQKASNLDFKLSQDNYIVIVCVYAKSTDVSNVHS